ncbi:hypothetical protein [Paraburkholderia sp. RL17-337-BIB-A]|uniref:hypothetical protein n=1 Tax=Paraburkholderia sp. RL17-337-BIB-A TaxID=3031636 RepID=UPI0038B7A9D9
MDHDSAAAQAVVDVRNGKTTGARACTVCVMVLTSTFANALLCADRHLYETLVRVTVYAFAPHLTPNKKLVYGPSIHAMKESTIPNQK